MQSGFWSFSRLEMASKRMKTFIFKNAKKVKNEEINSLITVSTKDISASRNARNFFKKGKLIFITISLRWAQSGFCSFNRLEVTSKTIYVLAKFVWEMWNQIIIYNIKSCMECLNLDNSNHLHSKNILSLISTLNIIFWKIFGELINKLPRCRYISFHDCKNETIRFP